MYIFILYFTCTLTWYLLSFISLYVQSNELVGSWTTLLSKINIIILQPLLKVKWGELMQHGISTYTKGGRTRASDLLTVTQWVKET